MAKAVKVGDQGTEHDGFPPTPVIAGSPTVNFDGSPAARVGDPLEPHDKPKHPPHDRAIASGSSTVKIDGKAAAITGGAISCGGVTIGGGTVNIGDAPSTASTKKIIAAAEELYDINLLVKDSSGSVCSEIELICVFSDGTEKVVKTNVKGEIKGLAKGASIKTVSLKPKPTKKWFLGGH